MIHMQAQSGARRDGLKESAGVVLGVHGIDGFVRAGLKDLEGSSFGDRNVPSN